MYVIIFTVKKRKLPSIEQISIYFLLAIMKLKAEYTDLVKGHLGFILKFF